MSQPTDPLAGAYAAYEQLEAKLSTAMDQLVATNGFAELFTTTATTMMAATKMANDAIDQVVRATRLAARQDVTSLAKQLARTEDKLERMLQAIEAIEDRLADTGSGAAGSNGTASRSAAAASAAAAPAPVSVTEPVTSPGEASRPVKRATVKRAAVKRAAVKQPAAKQPAAKRPAAKRSTSQAGDGR